MIIQTESLFNWMDEHNIKTVNKEQLLRFAHELETMTDDFKQGIIFASKMIEMQTKQMRDLYMEEIKVCQNCDFFEPEVDVCCCEESAKYAKFVDRMMNCEKWKKCKK